MSTEINIQTLMSKEMEMTIIMQMETIMLDIVQHIGGYKIVIANITAARTNPWVSSSDTYINIELIQDYTNEDGAKNKIYKITKIEALTEIDIIAFDTCTIIGFK